MELNNRVNIGGLKNKEPHNQHKKQEGNNATVRGKQSDIE